MTKIMTLRKIKKFAITTDWLSTFGGKSKGNKHLYRVVKIAKYLAKETDADIFIVEAGALLHDIALPAGDDSDYLKNKQAARNALARFQLNDSDIEAIAECVATHEGTARPKTPEAKIVHDADVLEKSGILGLIRHTWKMANSGQIDPENISRRDIGKIVHHIDWRKKQIQTSAAKKLHRKIDTKLGVNKLNIITPQIAKLAKKAVITEDIAKIISKELTKGQRLKLARQLSLYYLKH